jgi:hypothetical protein
VEIHPDPFLVRTAAEGEEANNQVMSETDLSSLSSIDSTPRQKPHLEIISATAMGSLGAHSEPPRGALAPKLQLTSSSRRVVETQLEGGMGMDLTLKNWNMEETKDMEGDDWDNKSDKSNEEMKSPTGQAYVRKASINTKPRQPIRFPTTPH